MLFLASACVSIFSGCARLRPETDPLLDQKAFFLATRAASFNRNIAASKGTGWARLQAPEKSVKFRMAWAAVFPNKIRITFLSSGLPVETITATGETITFFSHTGAHARHSYHSKDPDMEDYIRVPLKMSEMISVLLGRLPVKPFDDAYFSPADPSLSTVVLNRNGKRAAQYLHFNTDETLDRLQTISTAGTLLYEMNITKYASTDAGLIPVKIEITDMENRKLTLDITNFQANPPIKESMFRLTEPG